MYKAIKILPDALKGILTISFLVFSLPAYAQSKDPQWNLEPGRFNSEVARSLAEFEKKSEVINSNETQAYKNTDTFNLKEAIELAISTNPEFGLLSSNKRATDKELEQAKAGYLPSIDLRADGGVEYSENPAVDIGDDSETLGRYNTALTLTQMVFDGGDTFHETQRQKARVLSAANRRREGAELIGLSVAEFYLETIRRRQILEIAQENVQTHKNILRDIEENARAGQSTQADVIQVRARLEDALASVNDTKRRLAIARANFKREVGARAYNLVDPNVPRERLAVNVEQEVYASLDNSPTLSIFDADIKVAEEEFQAAKSSLFPEIDIELSGRHGYNLAGIQGTDNNATALMVMNWNLYRGGADTARIEEFKYRHSRAKEEYAEASREVENEVRNTWADLQASDMRYKNFMRQVQANIELVEAYKDQFFANRRTLLDVLDAQNELFVSRRAAANEKYLAKFNVYRLLSLKGNLLNTLDIKIAERL